MVCIATTAFAAENRAPDSLSVVQNSLRAGLESVPAGQDPLRVNVQDATASADSLDDDSCDATSVAKADTAIAPNGIGTAATTTLTGKDSDAVNPKPTSGEAAAAPRSNPLSGEGEPPATPPKSIQSDLTLKAAVTRAAGHTFTIFRLGLPESTSVTLEIVDDHGAKRRTVFNGELSAGDHAFPYDGRGERGKPLPTGMYTCRLESAGMVRSVPLNIAP